MTPDLPRKPLGIKSYGSIAHLPGSRIGIGDHKCHDGQMRIATEKARDRHDRIIVQEKLDGSNVGIARLNGEIRNTLLQASLQKETTFATLWPHKRSVLWLKRRSASVN